MYYACVVITLFNMGLYKSAFFYQFFWKAILLLFVFLHCVRLNSM